MTEKISLAPSSRRPDFALLLASASPRRAQLLETLGIPFKRIASPFEEPQAAAEDHAHPAHFVEHLAREKAAAVKLDADNAHSLVLSADTIVWHDGQILGKPTDEADARDMLLRLRGQLHQVFTGICLRHKNEYSVNHEVTTVHFNNVSDDWIARYVATGEPMDKAGAYAAQGRGALLVSRIEGDFWNVVGLPLATLGRMLEAADAPVESWWE